MLRKTLILTIFFCFVFLIGCGSSQTAKDVEQVINDAFKARAEAVFKYQDKQPLTKYFSPEALQQSKGLLDWSPKGQWDNVKDLKYSYSIRIENLKISGKQARAEVYETAVVSWDYIDPGRVKGTDFAKEDAWANRRHDIVVNQEPDGRWVIVQDLIR
ncbi:hypothetical protein Tfer_0167 [Thermincola ferriacetica]|uniref:DUF4829 domain-containing protein n=1 Tax=Thermincola ferriacetica TaxID=281456 RepID=A0A0L6W683_9FIRM|nr:hypothetical protein [Thermincola ferriacetica]KNZ71092.1 hypothetical protein Tfer_0167 [Thermincola ferriacetica]